MLKHISGITVNIIVFILTSLFPSLLLARGLAIILLWCGRWSGNCSLHSKEILSLKWTLYANKFQATTGCNDNTTIRAP